MNLHDEFGRLEARLGRLQPLAAELNREEFYFRAGQEAENVRRSATISSAAVHTAEGRRGLDLSGRKEPSDQYVAQ